MHCCMHKCCFTENFTFFFFLVLLYYLVVFIYLTYTYCTYRIYSLFLQRSGDYFVIRYYFYLAIQFIILRNYGRLGLLYS